MKTFRKLRPDWSRWPVAGLEQEIGPCVEGDAAVWFGIEFYEGEGMSGVGGVGRFGTLAGRVDVRRPVPLRDSSVNVLANDGRTLWIGT